VRRSPFFRKFPRILCRSSVVWCCCRCCWVVTLHHSLGMGSQNDFHGTTSYQLIHLVYLLRGPPHRRPHYALLCPSVPPFVRLSFGDWNSETESPIVKFKFGAWCFPWYMHNMRRYLLEVKKYRCVQCFSAQRVCTKKYVLYDRKDRQSQYTAIPPCNFKIMPYMRR